MNAGDTLWLQYPGDPNKHLYVAISDCNMDHVVIVNFTTFRGGAFYHDPECVVEASEHADLIHRSWIKYDKARLEKAATLRHIFTKLASLKGRSVSATLLGRIQAGALRSPHTPLDCAEVLTQQGISASAGATSVRPTKKDK